MSALQCRHVDDGYNNLFEIYEAAVEIVVEEGVEEEIEEEISHGTICMPVEVTDPALALATWLEGLGA